ncbi:hypothetical protein SADUNF_Sadunf09G0118400 [Salix dunnii]|uniref:Uncharacterized protein n=1 Tax=Salix dunnii TaxID=1413687 RepID=A0A835JYL4_9ROSI|nr:hypothetical protein SADUNF_Sadunf09G0118400 [Salix dunnii]
MIDNVFGAQNKKNKRLSSYLNRLLYPQFPLKQETAAQRLSPCQVMNFLKGRCFVLELLLNLNHGEDMIDVDDQGLGPDPLPILVLIIASDLAFPRRAEILLAQIIICTDIEEYCQSIQLSHSLGHQESSLGRKNWKIPCVYHLKGTVLQNCVSLEQCEKKRSKCLR